MGVHARAAMCPVTRFDARLCDKCLTIAVDAGCEIPVLWGLVQAELGISQPLAEITKRLVWNSLMERTQDIQLVSLQAVEAEGKKP